MFTIPMVTACVITRAADMVKIVQWIARNQSGATAIEYGLIAGLIAVAIMVSVVGTASEVGNSYSKTGSAMATATS